MTTPPMVADRIVIRPAAYELMAAHLAYVAEHADWQHTCLACQLWATLGVTVGDPLRTVSARPTIGS